MEPDLAGRWGSGLEPPVVKRHAQTVRDLIAALPRRWGARRADSRQRAGRGRRLPHSYMLPGEAEERFCMPPCMECGAMTADEAGSKCRNVETRRLPRVPPVADANVALTGRVGDDSEREDHKRSGWARSCASGSITKEDENDTKEASGRAPRLLGGSASMTRGRCNTSGFRHSRSAGPDARSRWPW